MDRTRRGTGRFLIGVVAALLVTLVAPAAAGAVTMTLQQPVPAPDKSGVVESGEWTIPDGGGTVTRTDSTGTYEATWQFSMPTTIPEGGTSFPITVMAKARPNSFGQATRFFAKMTVSGSIVQADNGAQFVDATADAQSTMTSEVSATGNADVKLIPASGTLAVTVAIQDGPRYTFTYVSDAAPAPTPTPTPAPTPECRSSFAQAAQTCPVGKQGVRVGRIDGEAVTARAGARGSH